MGTQVMNRRGLIAGGLAAAAAPSLLRAATPPVFPSRVERLAVGGRVTDMTVWQHPRPRGVALLSTGHGSWPDRYDMLAEALCRHRLAVLAPLHVDSVRHPDRAKFSMQASFGERIADLRAAAAFAARVHPRLPVIATGHSFGTLSSLCLAGGLGYLGDFREPAVRAVLGFSTPGRIPGLIQPSAFTAVKVPMLLVTGTADVVPQFVADPADHLLPIETASGPTFGIVVDRGRHELVGQADELSDPDKRGFGHVLHPVDLFVDGYALNNAGARATLARWKPTGADRFIVRNAA